MGNLLSTDDFRAAAKAGRAPEGTVYRFSQTEPQNVPGAARTKRFTFSDATVDHAGDSIDPKGWDLGVFNKNPVALFSHNAAEPPIGRARNVIVQGNKLAGDIEFASPEIYPFADLVFRLVNGGFLKAVSVGFMPLKWAFSGDKDRPGGIDFKSQRLLEVSICALPANPSALIEARGLGIDTRPLIEWAERVLDSGGKLTVPRRDLEALRRQAGAPERHHHTAGLKRSRRATTPAERQAEVAALRRAIGPERRVMTAAQRRVEAGDIARRIRAQDLAE
jgi:HK97 family phage prohead protease